MASKNGTLELSPNERAKLLLELQQSGDISADIPEAIKKELESAVSIKPKEEGSNGHLLQDSFGTGCLCCGEDDDHANLLLCEFCEAEYHTYCCEPPLRQVPTGDWYCSSCKSAIAAERYLEDDRLDRAVSALSPNFTSRFGEVVWAHGGVGFGWWPGFIYDPRFTVGSARELASKHLGKRHLVYFFECHEAPFAVLTTAKLTKWEDGLMEDFHMGKTAKSAGKIRLQSFRQAMQAATLELAKPIEMRMDWNHTELPQILPSPQKKNSKPPATLKGKKRRRNQVFSTDDEDGESSGGSDNEKNRKRKKQKRALKPPKGFPLLRSHTNDGSVRPCNRNLADALESISERQSHRINAIVESSEDGEFFVKLLYKPGGTTVGQKSKNDSSSREDVNPPPSGTKNVGFVRLPSRKTSTFANVRSMIQEELIPDGILGNVNWRFFIPGLGPVSTRQETSLGPIFGFLHRTTLDVNLGDGTTLNPIKIFVVDGEEYRQGVVSPAAVVVSSTRSNVSAQNPSTQNNVPAQHPNETKNRNQVNNEQKYLSLFDIVSEPPPLRSLLPSIPTSDAEDYVFPVSAFPSLSVFDVSVKFPALIIPAKRTNELRKRLQRIMLRRPRCKVVFEVRAANEQMVSDEQFLPLVDGGRLPPENCRKVVLDPEQVKIPFENYSIHPLLEPLVSTQQVGLVEHTMKFTYEDWTTDELLKRLLEPEGIDEIPSAFEVIGQLAHLNLRPQLLRYKYLIGKILLDKHQSAIRTIVNKVGSIDTQFRTFAMEVIAGYQGSDWSLVELKEEGCIYQLDFQKVYWNSRLAGEHRRLVKLIQKEQCSKANVVVVADMMAGIGPFAIPLTAKKNGPIVHANDLNPASYQYLVANGKKNNCHTSRLHTYNIDARAFCHQLQDQGINVHHFIMNLPASALEFLDAFRGYKVVGSGLPSTPTIHVHCFASKDRKEAHQSIYERAEKALGCPFGDTKVSIHNVRDVAPNKNMYCVTFQLPEAVRSLPRIKVGSDDSIP